MLRGSGQASPWHQRQRAGSISIARSLCAPHPFAVSTHPRRSAMYSIPRLGPPRGPAPGTSRLLISTTIRSNRLSNGYAVAQLVNAVAVASPRSEWKRHLKNQPHVDVGFTDQANLTGMGIRYGSTLFGHSAVLCPTPENFSIVKALNNHS
jgi:hypothetical protein